MKTLDKAIEDTLSDEENAYLLERARDPEERSSTIMLLAGMVHYQTKRPLDEVKRALLVRLSH